MTEHLGNLSLEDRMAKMQEINRKAAEYEQEQRDKAERRRIERQQAELQEFLERRGERYAETTGQTPPQSVLERWSTEFVEQRSREQEAERQRQLDQTAGQVF